MTEFATGETETASLALIVDNGSSPLKVCSVSLAPKADDDDAGDGAGRGGQSHHAGVRA